MMTHAAPNEWRGLPHLAWIAGLFVSGLLLVACPSEVPEGEPLDLASQEDAAGDGLAEVEEVVSDRGDTQVDRPDETALDVVEVDAPDIPIDTGSEVVEGALVLRTSRIGSSTQASGSDTFVLVGGLHTSQHHRTTGGDFILTGGL